MGLSMFDLTEDGRVVPVGRRGSSKRMRAVESTVHEGPSASRGIQFGKMGMKRG